MKDRPANVLGVETSGSARQHRVTVSYLKKYLSDFDRIFRHGEGVLREKGGRSEREELNEHRGREELRSPLVTL